MVGVGAVIVVMLGVAGALYLRGGSMPTLEEPTAVPTVPAPPQPSESPGAGVPSEPPSPPPAAQVSPAPAPAAAGAPAGNRPATGTGGRGQAASQGKAGGRALPSQSAPAAIPATLDPGTPAAQAAPAPAARIYLTTEVDVKPEVLTQVPPIYTDDAVKQNVKDVVVLQVLVDANGRPQTIKLLRGSQRAPLLNGSAAAAVRQWTFSPARRNGEPVPCWFNVGVPFPPAK
jgi:protein TonB